ncbi:MAG: hypothetical protein JSV44_06310 [Candidatus Zixiibacteriota bacterium]|nr:MAG: hypothetical protein JSV44_06310 [candidate division Zixibacteria bacterium]
MKKFQQRIKECGFGYILFAISERLPEWLFSYYHSVLLTCTNPKLLTRRYKDYAVRFATEADMDNLGTVGTSKEKALERFHRGDTCVIVEKDGRIVSISWVAIGEVFIRYGGTILDTGPEGLYLYGVYTIPEERMKGFIGPMFKSQLEYHARRNRKLAIGAVDFFNKPSLALHRRMGFNTVGETYGIIAAGISIVHYKKWPYKTRKLHVYFKRPPRNLPWV